jgi:hypothetical protein
MKATFDLRLALVAPALFVLASAAHAATIPVTGWAVHNGTATVGGTASNPTFTPGDNVTLMAPFTPVSLANDGDSVTVSTQLTMNTRTGTGVNALNTQLRLGLFSGPAGAVADSDIPNVGFTIEYTNAASGGLIREQQSLTQTNPFTSPTDTGFTGVQDAGADSIQGADPGPVTFAITLTRNAGKLDLSGLISGTDSVSGNPYSSSFTANGLSSANFPANGTFTFNRIGLFLGGNVNAASAALANSAVTTVPEPASAALAAGLLGAAFIYKRRAASKPAAN